MKDLKGAAALEFHKKLKERNEALHASEIESALALADAIGKERFDLDELEKLCDTSGGGRLPDVEDRHDIYERMYYVEYPKILTLKEFARVVETLSSWS
ncbi:hypothetical protein XBLMG947_1517 [Xanthomonas bromi]|uniref:Uncharacterized protein n=1 Tax=Xanthomonas bromi TaxID=56449 RepID=A0A1C3NK18_9XANT|nr:hypothetical protein [Xanthomonas bromi]PPV05899.1 hypothetical protein XbrCFBP1976_14970 [Xanthomonas bromi]SBV50735.1 hypothetical protein XBLMG947_1517 [Xanthomonas bromi]